MTTKRPVGRPRGTTKPNARHISFRLTLNAEEHARIKQLAAEAGVSVTKYVRTKALA